MTNNSSFLSTQPSINNLPLQKALISPFTIWAVIGVVNILASIWIIVVLVVQKPMKKDPLLLTIQMTVVEAAGGVAITLVGSYHVFKAVANEPETNSQFNCFLITGFVLFTIVILPLFYAQLSVDRFFTAIFPMAYSTRSKFYVYYISVPVWAIGFSFFGLCFQFTSREVTIPICQVTQSIETHFYDIYKYFVLSISIFAVLLYCSISVVLKGQSLKMAKSGGNIGDIKKRMHNKVMKSLACSALLHVFTTILATFSTSLLKSLQVPNFNLYVPYFASLYFVNSIISLPVYLAFQRKFRDGSLELMKAVATCRRADYGRKHNGITSTTKVTSTKF